MAPLALMATRDVRLNQLLRWAAADALRCQPLQVLRQAWAALNYVLFPGIDRPETRARPRGKGLIVRYND